MICVFLDDKTLQLRPPFSDINMGKLVKAESHSSNVWYWWKWHDSHFKTFAIAVLLVLLQCLDRDARPAPPRPAPGKIALLAPKIFKTAPPHPAPHRKCPEFNCYPAPPRGFPAPPRLTPKKNSFALPRGKKRLPCASPAPTLHDRVFKLFNWTQLGKPFSDQQHAVCGRHNSYICVKKTAYSTMRVENCRNLGAFLGICFGNDYLDESFDIHVDWTKFWLGIFL